MQDMHRKFEKTADICGNCRHYGFEVPDNPQVYAWSYCRKFNKHFKKNITDPPAYKTCAKFER